MSEQGHTNTGSRRTILHGAAPLLTRLLTWSYPLGASEQERAERQRRAERAFAELAADDMALAVLDDFSPIERVAVLAGFAAPGYLGYSSLQIVLTGLLKAAEPALPPAGMKRLADAVTTMRSALEHGAGGHVGVGDPRESPEGWTDPMVERWPAFRHSAAGRLCETLVPVLLKGHANGAASLESRSASLRAACGTLWVLREMHYGPVRLPSLPLQCIERVSLGPADEHAALRDAVVTGCELADLLRLLPQPKGQAARWRWASDFSECIWGRERFEFPKREQRLILKLLWEEYKKTGCGLATLTLREGLEARGLELPDSVDEGRTVSHVFKGQECLGKMLRSPSGKGRKYSLRPPPED